MKLWKATISVLLPPENPCGGLTPLTVAEILHSLPKGCIEKLPIPSLQGQGQALCRNGFHIMKSVRCGIFGGALILVVVLAVVPPPIAANG